MNPAVALQALVGGEIDYYTVLGPGVAAAIRGVPVKLVAAYVPIFPTAVIVRPEIESVRCSSESREASLIFPPTWRSTVDLR